MFLKGFPYYCIECKRSEIMAEIDDTWINFRICDYCEVQLCLTCWETHTC